MTYNIAFASSDSKEIDETFGMAQDFYVMEIENGITVKKWHRQLKKKPEQNEQIAESCGETKTSCRHRNDKKYELIEDCRCVFCTKAGVPAQRHLQMKAISVFEIEEQTIAYALGKVIPYFDRMDHHMNLRNM